MANRILRLPHVEEATGLSGSTIYRKIKYGEFPRPIPLGARAVGWLESDVQAFLQGCIDKARVA